MKILLTGKAGIGKSTILKKVASDLKMPKYGIVAREIRDGQNQRIGFEAATFDGRSSIFAHKFAFKTEFAVGKYHIDIKAIDDFIVPELRKGLKKNNAIIFIDEIGRMQSFSSEFLSVARDVFLSKSNLLATIVLEDEPWSLEFKRHLDTILIEVNTENREYLVGILEAVFSNTGVYDKLSSHQQEFVSKQLKNFILQNKSIQAKKLFKNAIVYVAEKRIKKIFDNSELIEYLVSGKNNKHKVIFYKTTNKYKCDCNLFNGRNEFKGKAGECSHIMALKILNIKK